MSLCTWHKPGINYTQYWIYGGDGDDIQWYVTILEILSDLIAVVSFILIFYFTLSSLAKH